MTYQPQMIYRALFAPDGRTIVFSAALKGTSVELFTLSPEFPAPRNLGLRDTQLLSVSSKGELAVLTGAKYVSHRLFRGVLARVPLGGGAPREILEGVREADWAPDGGSLAIVHDVDGRDRLEFPVGKVLYEASGYLSDLRVSPSGDRIAFFDHPIKFDDRGSVAMVDLSGKKSTLAGPYWSLQGLVWSRDGREVLFSAVTTSLQKVFGVDVNTGKVRGALESAGDLTVHDMSADGRWIASRDDISFAMMAKAPGAHEESNLSWLDFSQPAAIASDGRTLLFTEMSGVVGFAYQVCLRKTDGSPIVRLGDGMALDLSPDGKWALATVPGDHEKLMLYPTGPGQPHQLDSGPIEYVASGRWFLDGKRALVCGNEPGKAERCYVTDAGGGTPRAVTPEDTHRGIPSPDGQFVLVHQGPNASGAYEIYPIAGGAPRMVPDMTSDDLAIRWNRDGRSVIVSHGSVPARMERVDLETGRRELLETIGPSSPVGITAVRWFTLADDPAVYAYEIDQHLSRLFMLTGAR